jgi:hypothetical protein
VFLFLHHTSPHAPSPLLPSCLPFSLLSFIPLSLPPPTPYHPSSYFQSLSPLLPPHFSLLTLSLDRSYSPNLSVPLPSTSATFTSFTPLSLLPPPTPSSHLVFLKSFDSCIFISSIIVVGSSSSFVIHPHISFGCILVKLEQQESIQS